MGDLALAARPFAHVHPADEPMIVQLLAPDADYWPLPFYLRRYPVVYESSPYEPSLIIVHEDAEPKPTAPYEFVGYHGLRPTVHMWVYAREELKARWEEFVARGPGR